MSQPIEERRSLHLAALIAAGLLVGVVVALLARSSAGASCGGSDAPGFGSPCEALVSSLALRVGCLAGAVTVLMGLLGQGLARTAEKNEEVRRTLSDERGATVQ